MVCETISKAHLIFCESRLLLDRTEYPSWRDIQEAYNDYKTSLGPWSEAEIVSYLEIDWGPDDLRWPFTRWAVAEFFQSGERVLVGQNGSPTHE